MMTKHLPQLGIVIKNHRVKLNKKSLTLLSVNTSIFGNYKSRDFVVKSCSVYISQSTHQDDKSMLLEPCDVTVNRDSLTLKNFKSHGLMSLFDFNKPFDFTFNEKPRPVSKDVLSRLKTLREVEADDD